MDSPFSDILRTNTVPSDRECQQIRQSLEDPLQQLVQLDQEIARLEKLLYVAYQKRDDLHSFTDAHLALLSPARRLPDDIVRAVFLASLPEHRNPAISWQESPLLLGQICSAWRHIALETPRLWVSIHIAVPDEGKVSRLTDQVGAWLRRSGAVPLNISLGFSKAAFADANTDSGCDISPLLSVLLAECHRWSRIHLIFTDSPSYSPICMLDPEAVPLLRSFSVEFRPRNPVIALLAPQNIQSDSNPVWRLLGANNLQSLTIPGSEIYLRAPIVWRNLKHLSILRYLRRGITNDIALGILSRCPLLETCKLYIVRANHAASISYSRPQQISLPFLTELTVLNEERTSLLDGATQLFKDLTLPILRSFHSQGLIRPGQIPFPRQQIFPNELHMLEYLHVDLGNLPTELLIEILSETPALRELSISSEPHTQDLNFLIHLMPTAETPQPPCPQLQMLKLAGFQALPDETLLQFIQSRLHSPLSRVVCDFQRGIQLDIMAVPEIQEAVAAGLKVDLTYLEMPAAYSALEGTQDYV
ncbi:hypothetical protein FB45DRAFT_1007806 [Roridomyces roridus]|uniref:F-box domain-containing protein n=1 Tax=Roridomyces roridus TaxID=1738132 RepID=A0AAD7FDA7_9AGAR|nr:hypothetical protein FB45DRAFT_1007806 [Roridomyces roridus]